ncbi:aldo/keto reductase [Aggregicoccus sp. 17bor-14]|uniref:aldo/keto reductase n=1 Tax=Myxococcaceae TaxID=31 RepID=UPI00129C511C|nr:MULTISPECIES: aldo/keto reductase [Myxococcaceae]MBF5042627.1 aldo/keto reductase [Simulacricoccus sp. 17bor-14]MRI88395.1 aldo/keto reductase [Aggregicoccus sp. 17bor-14]
MATAARTAGERVKLGREGPEVSRLCLGGNVFGWTLDEKGSFAVLDAFLEGGGNFIDTADVYSSWVPGNQGGESETLLGKWMASRKVRERVVIATKVGSPMPTGKGLGAAHIQRACDDSLRRLGVERIDLYYAHRDDPDTAQEETAKAFDALVRAGKVRQLGASNFDAGRLASALELSRKLGLARYAVLQPEYNLVSRDSFEGPLQQLCEREGIAVAPYFGLAAGFLTGKYREGQPPPDTKRAEGVMKRYANPRGWRALAALEKVAKGRGQSLSQTALAWLAAQPTVTSPIASATSPEQVRELLGAFRSPLSGEELRQLAEATR